MLQIEQFIETLYPKQDPAKLNAVNKKRQMDEPTSDPGEGFVMWLVVIMSLVFMALVMIGIAWFFGADFSSTLPDIKKLWTSLDGPAKPPQPLAGAGRDEL